tara:strand:+ start:2618 stop:3883 length:1266 start_codon:yes stop_codon:yes gene_type:complete
MTDLNLNFDTGIKSVTMGPTSNDNISVSNQNSPSQSPSQPSSPQISSNIQNNSAPSLSVSDPVGIEFLAKGSNPPTSTNDNSPKSTKSEEFNFFKPSEPEPEKKTVDTSNDDMIANPKQVDNSEFKPIHRLTPQDIKNEKIDLLYKFKKLEGQGIRTTMNYNMNSHLEDMRNEYVKLKKQREIDNAVKFQRKMLMACVTGLEFLNNRFDPFSVQLDGWGESVNENLNDYDEIFEELNEKYGGGGDMAPEIRLLFTLAGSAFMFHLSNTMFKSSIPGMDDVLQQNPELMKQFAEAAVGSMNKGPQQGMPGQQQQQQRPPEPPNPLAAMMGLGGGGNPMGGMMNMMMGGLGGGPSRQQGGQQGPKRTNSPARSDMSGPDGIDDLINKMNLQPDKIPDLDAISLMSGETDKKSSGTERGITLNL